MWMVDNVCKYKQKSTTLHQLSIELAEKLMILEQRIERRLFNVSSPTVYRSLKQELTRIYAALERMDAGTYGRCQLCTVPINLNRLQFLPYAELCFSCQRNKEREETTQNLSVAQ